MCVMSLTSRGVRAASRFQQNINSQLNCSSTRDGMSIVRSTQSANKSSDSTIQTYHPTHTCTLISSPIMQQNNIQPGIAIQTALHRTRLNRSLSGSTGLENRKIRQTSLMHATAARAEEAGRHAFRQCTTIDDEHSAADRGQKQCRNSWLDLPVLAHNGVNCPCNTHT